MKFYKIEFAHGQDVFAFKCEAEFNENSLIIDYASKENILPANFYFEELKAEAITESDYTKHLLNEIEMVLSREISWRISDIKSKKEDEILSECRKIVILSDICYAMSEADAGFFNYNVLENWLKHKNEMSGYLLERIICDDHSRENEAIMDLISAGWEE